MENSLNIIAVIVAELLLNSRLCILSRFNKSTQNTEHLVNTFDNSNQLLLTLIMLGIFLEINELNKCTEYYMVERFYR